MIFKFLPYLVTPHQRSPSTCKHSHRHLSRQHLQHIPGSKNSSISLASHGEDCTWHPYSSALINLNSSTSDILPPRWHLQTLCRQRGPLQSLKREISPNPISKATPAAFLGLRSVGRAPLTFEKTFSTSKQSSCFWLTHWPRTAG